MTRSAAFLDSLSPAMKLLAAVVLIACVLIPGDAAYISGAAILLLVASRAVRGPALGAKKKPAPKGLWLLALGLALVAATQLFWNPLTKTGFPVARTFLGEAWTGGIASTLVLLSRIGAVVAAMRFIAAYLDPAEAAEGMEAILSPLARVGLRPEAASTAFAIAIRFSSLLGEEARQLLRAQRARGLETSRRGPFRAFRTMVPLVLPIFALALGRAERLALSMESRCFGLARRSSAGGRPSFRGALAALALVALIALSFISRGSAPAESLIASIFSH